MSIDSDNTPAFDGQEEDALAGLHDYLRQRAESARSEVVKWNAVVDEWRVHHGRAPIPIKAFEKHPAAAMLANIFQDSGIVEEAGALQGAAMALCATNGELRSAIPYLEQLAAQFLDSADQTSDPVKSLLKARFYGLLVNAVGLLLELRTTTSKEIFGLPVANIPGCILARTADVREGSGDE